MPTLVPRWVTLLTHERDSAASVNVEKKRLIDFADEPAWVLLGEPGAGKSKALQEEANRVGGEFLTVAELMSTDPLPDQWRNKTIFLDGLDEARIGGVDPYLHGMANKLRQLGQPKFRLACRAADWESHVYTASLSKVSGGLGNAMVGAIKELRLVPLSESDIQTVLETNFSISNSAEFLARAKEAGIEAVLCNPQMLELMVLATQKGSAWPETKKVLFELACSELVLEKNQYHKISQKAQPLSSESILDAAGESLALMLFAGKAGVATDEAATSDLFPNYVTLYSAGTEQSMLKALNTSLFIPSQSSSRLVPCHRLVAEYLAARWLNAQLSKKQILPLRLFRLLFSPSGKVFGSVRGLAGWLASLNEGLCKKVIAQDVMTVLNYADLKVFSAVHRRQVLAALKTEAEQSPAFFRQSNVAEERLPDLASVELLEDLRRDLNLATYSSANEAHLFSVLNVVAGLADLSALSSDLYGVFPQREHWRKNRALALSLWLKPATPQDIQAVLNDLQTGALNDTDDELLGTVLCDAYPAKISTPSCLAHLRQEKDEQLIGAYQLFWDSQFLQLLPNEDLPVVLDHLVEREDLFGNYDLQHIYRHLADDVLVRALTLYGDEVSDEQLFRWLGVGADKFGGLYREPKAQSAISAWLEQRPQRRDCMLGLPRNELKEQHRNYLRHKEQALQRVEEQRKNKYAELQAFLPEVASGASVPKLYDKLARVWLGYFYGSSGASVEDRFNAYCTNAARVQAAAAEGFIKCLFREDMPNVKDIIQLNTEGRHFYLELPCVVGAGLLWQQDSSAFQGLPTQVLKNLIAIYLTVPNVGSAAWFEWLVVERAEWVVRVWLDLTVSQWRAKKMANPSINLLEQNRTLALDMLPEALQKFPLRANVALYPDLIRLLTLALKLMPEQLVECVQQKLTKGSIVKSQRAHWLAVAFLLAPESKLPSVMSEIEQSTERATELLLALQIYMHNYKGAALPSSVVGTLIEHALPIADLSSQEFDQWPNATPTSRLGELVRALMLRLEQDFSAAATAELQRLKLLGHSEEFQRLLQHSAYRRDATLQERQDQQHSLESVRAILLNQQPSTMADLQAILIDTLEYINESLRNSNDDSYRLFWNIDQKKPPVAKDENPCRDVLLTLLRERLSGLDISLEPEVDQNADKRVDIRADYQNRWSLPIEIKKDSHKALWTAIKTQLIPQYVSQERTEGFGVYLVLWFGDGKIKKNKQGAMPTSPEQLRRLLEAQLNEDEQSQIKVVVVDVSLPAK